MNTETIQLIIQGGFAAVTCVLLVWQHQERRDMTKRIRQLEESRAQEIKFYAEKVTEALVNNTAAVERICDVLRARPCLADPEPHNYPPRIPTPTDGLFPRRSA